MKKVVSPHVCRDLSRLSVLIIWDFSSPTKTPLPNFSADLGTLCLDSHTREYKDKWPWREAPFLQISILSTSTLCAVQKWGGCLESENRKKFLKLGFLFLFCPKGGKWSYTGRNIQLQRETYLPSFGVYKEWLFAKLKTQRKKIREVFTLLACQREVKVLKGEYIWVQMQN